MRRWLAAKNGLASDSSYHMLTCMLAHFFLWRLKIRMGKKAPSITLSRLRVLIRIVLPTCLRACLRVARKQATHRQVKRNTFDSLIWQIEWIQDRNHRAYLSHRRRRMREIAKEQ